MADEKGISAICENCGETFHKNEQDSDSKQPYCSRCMVELAEQYVPETSDRSKLKRIRKSRVGVTLLWITLFACISIIAIQVPKLISVFIKEEKPIRYGPYSTDARTDQCIQNLWQISRGLQEGKLPDDSLVCPASNKPYQVVRTDDEIIVRSPSPELYGYREIRVSKRKPVPEIVK